MYAVAWVVGLIVYAVCGKRALPAIAQVVIRLMGFRLTVYGNVDEQARITVFNHPQRVDLYLLTAAAGPISGLISHNAVGSWIFEKLVDCVRVKDEGGQNTTVRMREHVKKGRWRYCIAVNRVHHPDVGGRYFKDQIGTFKTIAFRLGEAVQPCVIVAKRSSYANREFTAMDVLAHPLNETADVQMFFLPTMHQGAAETPEAFAARTKKAMNTCLHHAWRLRT